MKIFFRCPTCKLEQGVEVPDRNPEGDVIEWMQIAVSPIVGAYHRYLKPSCLSIHFDMALPVDKNKPLGVAFEGAPQEPPSFLGKDKVSKESEELFKDDLIEDES